MNLKFECGKYYTYTGESDDVFEKDQMYKCSDDSTDGEIYFLDGRGKQWEIETDELLNFTPDEE